MDDSSNEGNPYLRQMSVGAARSKCKLDMRNDPELREKYKRWVEANEQKKASMGAAFRGVDRGGRMGSAE